MTECFLCLGQVESLALVSGAGALFALPAAAALHFRRRLHEQRAIWRYCHERQRQAIALKTEG